MPPSPKDDYIYQRVDALFRREAGRLVSMLTRFFGPARIDLAEDVVQDALGKALQHWPYRGIPDNPSAWLARVAKNRALDILRAESALLRATEEIGRRMPAHGVLPPIAEIPAEDAIHDDQLRMIFLCCHPCLPVESQVALTLKTLCGFSVEEIAHGLRVRAATVAQRLTRARRLLRAQALPFALPDRHELAARLDAVLHVLYLLFNAGYSPHSGADLVRGSLCEDALYLASLLVHHAVGDRPAVHALLALMLLQSSRLRARADGDGNLLLLAEQDRSLWDRRAIEEGFLHLQRAQSGDTVTQYHLEAGIAACHAAAPTYDDTDWASVVELYDTLLALTGSAIVGLNRAVAVAMRHGPERGLAELQPLCAHPSIEGYYLLPATSGFLHAQMGEQERARAEYERALRCACNEPERRFLHGKLSALSS
jgi:RNA polymerase sigma factor (sigma-70 family)